MPQQDVHTDCTSQRTWVTGRKSEAKVSSVLLELSEILLAKTFQTCMCKGW